MLLLLILVLFFPSVNIISNMLQIAYAQLITCPNTTLNFDDDGDSISNNDEIKGIDVNNDKHIDLNLTALGADPLHKDIFLEIDYMQNHRPNQAGIDNLATAFQNAPVCNPDGVTGIALHVLVDDEITHNNIIQIECFGGQDWSGFDSLKNAFLGSVNDRHDPNVDNIMAAKRHLYHYAIFIHDFSDEFGRGPGVSGCSDPPHMNMVVSLGSWQRILGTDPNTNDVLSNSEYEVGTLMHEFDIDKKSLAATIY